MPATRCKHCAGDVPLSEEMQRTLQLATAALDAEEDRRQKKWYRRLFAPCARCFCCKPQQAVISEAADGQAQLQPVDEASTPVVISPLSQSLSGSGVVQRGGSSSLAGRPGSSFVSPQQSFSSAAPAEIAIDIVQLAAQEQSKDR